MLTPTKQDLTAKNLGCEEDIIEILRCKILRQNTELTGSMVHEMLTSILKTTQQDLTSMQTPTIQDSTSIDPGYDDVNIKI